MESADGIAMEEMIQTIIRLASHEEIAHHVPGRIRLKILPSGLEHIQGEDVEALLKRVPGIVDIRINTLARSIVVDYDQGKLPYDLWEALGQLKTKPELEPELADRMRSLWTRSGKRQ